MILPFGIYIATLVKVLQQSKTERYGPKQQFTTRYLDSIYLTLCFFFFFFFFLMISCCGGRGSSAVKRATPGEEVPGSIPAVAARSLQVGSVSV